MRCTHGPACRFRLPGDCAEQVCADDSRGRPCPCLTRGAEPRIDLPHESVSDLALHEIAGSAFSQEELAPFLPELASTTLLPAPDPTTTELRGDGTTSAAAAPVASPQETVH